jgi:exocyst complex protein 7
MYSKYFFLHSSRDIRSSTLELTLKQLGVEYVTPEELHNVQIESLNAKIPQWVQCLQIAVMFLNFDHIRFIWK